MNIDLQEPLSIDWDNLTPESSPGKTGHALIKTILVGEIKIRMVEYSAHYLGDHWCTKGHIVQVLHGQLTLELEHANPIILEAGMMVVIGDDRQPHRAMTEIGAQVLIVE